MIYCKNVKNIKKAVLHKKDRPFSVFLAVQAEIRSLLCMLQEH